ncbi:MAG: hypothetical protein DWH81_11030 [Planctomycetota bacterium]|nr:MAG: hypothetical protein DWH81_11030 [Planctomycetota bacterium]
MPDRSLGRLPRQGRRWRPGLNDLEAARAIQAWRSHSCFAVLHRFWSNKTGQSPEELFQARGIVLRTADGKFIDLLAMDRDANLVIIELKRDKAPRDVIAQAQWCFRSSNPLLRDPLQCIIPATLLDDGRSCGYSCGRTLFQLRSSTSS